MFFLKEQEDMSEEKQSLHGSPCATYFENARKGKVGTVDSSQSDSTGEHCPNVGKIMNPIDPGETSETFMHMRRCMESNYVFQHAVDSGKSESTDKHRTSSARRQRNMGTESGSENSSGSVRTRMHSNHHRRTSSYPKNGPPEGGSYEYKHHRTTSVPKFGDWDETDPTSGEGFTVIFNKVKEEKHAPPASNIATMAPEVKTMDYSDCHHRKCPTPSWGSKSKVCCCLF